MSRSWSPPLDIDTRTLTSISVIRARPEHLDAIHDIQLKAYPDRPDYHESPQVFESKLASYPAGNFIAIVTSSVVTNDDTSTWIGQEDKDDENVSKAKGDESVLIEEQDDDDNNNNNNNDSTEPMDQDLDDIHEITVVEITETGPDGSDITGATTTLTDETHFIRARTPNIFENDDDDDDDKNDRSSFLSSSTKFKSATTLGSNDSTERSSQSQRQRQQSKTVEEEDEDDDKYTVLFQWEQPVGYLFSHPYSRESMTLHRTGPVATKAETTAEEKPSNSKKIRLDNVNQTETGLDTEESESDTDPYDHDQYMEKYYVHDCAIHPDWRSKGLALKLWKALEESLTPSQNNDLLTKEGLVDTEDEDEDDVDGPDDEKEGDNQQQKKSTEHHHHHHHRKSRKSKKSNRRRGAPNLKEIYLVSVQDTRPFWERAGGFQVVSDHDMDLSIYGDGAFLMRKAFTF
ncbi:hypothetical protein BGZ46_001870 [Entomortierella lignicola]|nr:hypothetical protein BGZ46_001870 [Entomortierella lignicola]